jgi:hypothetical protein
MPEIRVNIHMHTRYSDGSGTHREIANAALQSGLDAVIVTDHNVFVEGVEGYYEDGHDRVLMLVGEEIHNQTRQPQKSHLLVFGAGRELSYLAWDLKKLIERIHENGGVAFVAHPNDPAAKLINEPALTWEDWDAAGLDGLEIWNGLSEFKSRISSLGHMLYYAYKPSKIAKGPFPETLRIWDDFLATGRHLAAIGGSDAHALKVQYGPIKRTIFPYSYHFRMINTHLILDEPLNGDINHDRALILTALKAGKSFIANDSPESGCGFIFSAKGIDGQAGMGETISGKSGVTLQIRLPSPAECRLLMNGEVIQIWRAQTLCTFITSKAGAYRVEVYRNSQGRRVGWIFSNPIYIG